MSEHVLKQRLMNDEYCFSQAAYSGSASGNECPMLAVAPMSEPARFLDE